MSQSSVLNITGQTHSSKRTVLTRREWLAIALAGITAVNSKGFLLRASTQHSMAGVVNPAVLRDEIVERASFGFQYLESEMDRWSHGTIVYDDVDSGAAAFTPSVWIGDEIDLGLEHSTVSPAAGETCLKLTYKPTGPKRWAGIYWTYPNGNLGESPGYDLTGATRLKLWARGEKGEEIVEFEIGGVNRFCHTDSSKPNQDNLGPLVVRKKLSRDWQPIEIPLPRDESLKNTIGGFAWVASTAYNPDGCVVYLDQIAYDDAKPNGLRLIRSYTTTEKQQDRPIRNAAYVYDNDLALLALLSARDESRLHRARILADSIVWAQNNDRAYNDGRWRNAYSCGPLEDRASQKARLPGWYEEEKQKNGECEIQPGWKEDYYAVSADTGNTAWTIIALLAAHNILEAGKKDSPYLEAAVRAGQWIEENFRAGGKLGGYTGGLEGWEASKENPVAPKKVEWRSTEHCIDLYVAFSKLATAKTSAVWQECALHARRFVLNMWKEVCFSTGTKSSQEDRNEDMIPTDVQIWSVLAMGHDTEFRQHIGWTGPPSVPACLKWVETNCRVDSKSAGDPSGYLFSNKGKGCWFEGAAQVAAIYRYLGNLERSEKVLSEIMRANPVAQRPVGPIQGAGPPVSVGGIYAACSDPIEAGFYKIFVPAIGKCPQVVGPVTYPRRQHLGATAWFLLAAAGVNPYWLEGPPAANK